MTTFIRYSHAMSQSFGRRPSFAEGWIRYQASLSGIYGTQVTQRQILLRMLVSSRQYHSANDFYSCFFYQPSPLYSCRCRFVTLEATLNARVK